MSDDLSDHYALMKEHSKLKRAANRAGTAEILTARGIQFESKNYGAHLIVTHDGKKYDAWPGTGRYHDRSTGIYGRGVMNLIRLMTTTAKTTTTTTDKPTGDRDDDPRTDQTKNPHLRRDPPSCD